MRNLPPASSSKLLSLKNKSLPRLLLKNQSKGIERSTRLRSWVRLRWSREISWKKWSTIGCQKKTSLSQKPIKMTKISCHSLQRQRYPIQNPHKSSRIRKQVCTKNIIQEPTQQLLNRIKLIQIQPTNHQQPKVLNNFSKQAKELTFMT